MKGLVLSSSVSTAPAPRLPMDGNALDKRALQCVAVQFIIYKLSGMKSAPLASRAPPYSQYLCIRDRQAAGAGMLSSVSKADPDTAVLLRQARTGWWKHIWVTCIKDVLCAAMGRRQPTPDL